MDSGFVLSSQFFGLKIDLCSLYVKYHFHLCCVSTSQVLNQDLEELPEAHYSVSRKGLTSDYTHHMEKRCAHPFPLHLHSCDKRTVQL